MSKVYGAAFQYQYTVEATLDQEAVPPGNLVVLPEDSDASGVVHAVPVDNDDADYDAIPFKGYTLIPGIFRKVLSSSDLGSPAATVKFAYRSNPDA